MVFICEIITAVLFKGSRLLFREYNGKTVICLAAALLAGTVAGLLLVRFSSAAAKKYSRKKGLSCREISGRMALTMSLLFSLLSALCLLASGFTVLAFRNWLLLCCLFYASLTDIQARVIPDIVPLAAVAIWAAAAVISGMSVKQAAQRVLNGLVFGGAALLLALIMDKRLHKESLGGGDIKLFFVMGLYLTGSVSLFAVMAASLSSLVYIVLMRLFRKEKLTVIAFGPFIALGITLMLFFGERISVWYAGRF